MHKINSLIIYDSKKKTSVADFIPFTRLIKDCRVLENFKECNEYIGLNIFSYGVQTDRYARQVESLLQEKNYNLNIK